MGSFLSELTGAREPLFSMTLRQLEEVSARPGVDVRVIAEIVGKLHQKTAELGLDARDTKGLELYHALMATMRDHDKHLSEKLGITKYCDVESTLPQIQKAITNLDMPNNVWVIKKSVAKRLLKAMPPRAVMKHLGYSSVDSMIKREKVQEIFGAMRFTEPQEWQEHFIAQYRSLAPSDFETRKVEVLQMPRERWVKLAEQGVRTRGHNISHLKELGVVLLLPTTMAYWQGITITALSLALHYVNEIRLYSSYFKLHQVKLQFGATVARAIAKDTGHSVMAASVPLHWRVVHRHLGGKKPANHPRMLEPHIQAEDLHWRRAEDYVYMIDPELGFWRGLDYVGTMSEGKPLSLNLIDAAQCFATNAPFSNRLYGRMREALLNEIYARYLNERILEEQILLQLDSTLTASR